MPNSLRARLKKCVHKGILDEKDIDRLIVLPPHVSLDTSYEEAYKLGYDAAMEEVKAIVFNRYSLVTPQPKTGHWIEEFNDLEGEVRFTCSSCGKYQLFGTDYCYNCGAKMEVEK